MGLRLFWARHKQLLLTLIVPSVLSPILVTGVLLGSSELKCGFVALLMAIFWMLELLPLPVTALFPLVLYPTLEIINITELSAKYFAKTNVLVFGGLIFAVAIEQWNVHKRLALGTLLLFGSSRRMVMLGFMLIGWFLSMWISNTATTAMCMPIAIAVVQQFRPKDPPRKDSTKVKNNSEEETPSGGDNNEIEMALMEIKQETTTTEASEDEASELGKYVNYKNGLFLSVAYACNIGGTATLTGTGPNALLMEYVDEKYGKEAGFNFGTFMIYSLPESAICLLYSYFVLNIFFLPRPKFGSSKKQDQMPNEENVRHQIKKQYNDLGSIRTVEKIILVSFVALALLWFFRAPQFIPGWEDVTGLSGWVDDGTVVMAVDLFLFMCPSFATHAHAQGHSRGGTPSRILTWKMVQENLPWNLIFLLGGGFAMASGVKDSGLDKQITHVLENLEGVPRELLLFINILTIGALTEFTSNTSTASIILPIMASLAVALGENPLFFFVPTIIACSFAFCLPVATPPNAIAFGEGNLEVKDMVRVGIFLNLGCFLIATFFACTWGNVIFDMSNYPSWA